MAEEEEMIDAQHVALIVNDAAARAVEKAKPELENIAFRVARQVQDECIVQFHQTFQHILNINVGDPSSIKGLQKVMNHAEEQFEKAEETAQILSFAKAQMERSQDVAKTATKGTVLAVVSFIVGGIITFIMGKS